MSYVCYTRAGGRNIVEVQPTVTIRFDQLTAITRNRVRRVFKDNYCPWGWSSKPQAILNAMQGHYKVFGTLLAPAIMSHPDFDKEMFATKALLLDYHFSVLKHTNPNSYRYGFGNLLYKGYDNRWMIMNHQMNKLAEDTLLPITRKLIDHKKLAPIMKALEARQPYTFAGVNM